MRFAEDVTVIGATVFGSELLDVSGRVGDVDGLWVRRVWPAPAREYGVVRFPLSPRPLHAASMWTSDWPLADRAELTDRTVAVYRAWIADGCPEWQPFADLPRLVVAP